MKKITIIIALFSISFISCSTGFILRDKISINELITAKQEIDNSQNPAEILLLKNDLIEKVLILEGVLVKDIIPSTNVDYDFCILTDLQTDKGLVECYIYTKNVRRIALLKKGVSVIDVKGEFTRFFSMLDNYYTKVEITNSIIDIQDIEENPKKDDSRVKENSEETKKSQDIKEKQEPDKSSEK